MDNNMPENSTKSKKTKRKIGLDLCQKAAVILSLLSFYTTKQGFENTVFIGSHPAWPILASFAIQTILLAGVLFGSSIIRNISAIKRTLAVFIWLFTASVSIAFSYISIVNKMYYIDFAVNGNQILESYVRDTILQLDNKNSNNIKELRPELVQNLNENGYDVISADVLDKALNYVDVTSDYQLIEKEAYLAEVETEYFKNGYVYLDETSNIPKATKEFVQNKHPGSYADQTKPDNWLTEVSDTINKVNGDGYTEYVALYEKASVVADKYNDFRHSISNGQMPALDQMHSLVSECETLLESNQHAIDMVSDYKIVDKWTSDKTRQYDNKTANLYVEQGVSKLKGLLASANTLKATLDNLIKSSYGENNKSVDEIIALVGNSNTTTKELESALTQMLTAQASILKEQISSHKDDMNQVRTGIEDINELMENLDTYVKMVGYHERIETFKQTNLSATYNIVKNKDDDGNKLKDSEKVENVTPEEWTQKRKIIMAELLSLIFEYPIYETTEEEFLSDMQAETYEKQKLFLDTSESEKAHNLLLGEKENFPYKGKAYIALIFAKFMDLGAAAVGILIDLIKGKKLRERT